MPILSLSSQAPGSTVEEGGAILTLRDFVCGQGRERELAREYYRCICGYEAEDGPCCFGKLL